MKKIIVSLFFLLVNSTARVQTFNNPYPNIIQPSPNAASLGRYAEIPVTLETGVPNISIPLYTIQSSDITIPISISYHASGIKVMDQASSVGLGWALNSGGNIVRVKQGIYDERTNGFYNIIFPDPQDPDYSNKMNALYTGMNVNEQYKMDGQPDIFYYNFAGKTGKFMFKNRVAKGLPPEILTFPHTPLKITFLDDWKTIQVVDEEGTLYVFGKSLQGIDYREQSTWGSPGLTNEDGYPYPSTWHLTNIVSVNKHNSITLKYDLAYETSMYNKSNSINEEFIPNFGGTSTLSNVNYTSSLVQSSTSGKLLTEIIFTNGRITYAYSTSPGTQIKQLDNIKIYNQKGLLKSFKFSYSKFKNSGIEVTEKNGLRLDSCTEISAGGVSSKPYVFLYSSYQQFEVPPYNELKPHSEDLWGYFNNSKIENRLLVKSIGFGASTESPISVAHGRKANSNFLMVGTLKSIKYPTGGEAQFKFEPNQIERTYVNRDTTFSWFSKSISNIYGGPGDLSYATLTFNEPQQLLTQSVTTYSAMGGDETFYYNVIFRFRVNRFCNPVTDPNCNANKIDVSLIDLTTGQTLKRWQWDGDFIQNPYLNTRTDEVYLTIDPSHRYQLKFNDANALSNNGSFAFRLDASLTGKYKDYTVTSTPVSETVLCGGLRIKEQQLSDPTTGKGIMKTYSYLKPYFNSNLFEGDFDKLAKSVLGFDKYENVGQKLGGSGLRYRTYTENLTVPIGSANNSSVSYEQVEEIQKDVASPTNNGKIVYTYWKATDWVTPFLPFYKFDNGDLRSLLLNKKVYSYENNSFKLLNEVRFVYKNLVDPEKNKVKFILSNMTLFDSSSHITGFNRFWGLGFPATGGIHSEFKTSEESLQSHKYVEDSVIVTNYAGATSMITTTKYNYANKVVPLPTEIITKTSKNETTTQHIKYTADKLPVANCANNCETNFVAKLKALKVSLYQCQTPAVKAFRDNYGIYGNEGLSNRARADYQACQTTFENGVLNLVASINTCRQEHKKCNKSYYDSFSSEIAALYELVERNVISLPIEERIIVNNKLTSTKKGVYHIFDQDNIAISKVRACTGSAPIEDKFHFNRYDASGNLLERQKANDVKEIYLWGYNGQYPVAKIIGTDYTTAISKVSQSQINAATAISNNDLNVRNLVNNFRTIPNTLVTTYTYEPLVGITSETDINNRTTYYEYDGFQRLVLIRDHDKNIIKRICYNYAGEQENCGTTTYNSAAKSGTFTRNNCSSGSTGSSVTYTVPAGKYTSTVSQADADTKAQNDVNANGQAYANTNGACTVPCNSSNCSGVNKKCINGVCAVGTRVDVGSYHDGSQWVCIYYYKWSDGTRTSDMSQSSSSACPTN
ncbi:MAG: hypothetical protein KF862_11570 [Chitinophagaceae bacterium]|nr:hypothetical protein [Chitinophagaceae bacterium]